MANVFQVNYWRARAQGRPAFYWFVLGCLSIGLQFLAGSPAIIAFNLIAYVSFGIFGSVPWVDPHLSNWKIISGLGWITGARILHF